MRRLEAAVVEIKVRYEGGLRCEAQHGPSGTRQATDAPVDNQGKGETFSPTDLVATALGTCMLTTMGILAKRKGWNIDGIDLTVHKHMTTQPPRRVARLPVKMVVPGTISAALEPSARAELEAAARTCPVALSLNPEIALDMEVAW
jgi:uncharacterized OsmC-like protein